MLIKIIKVFFPFFFLKFHAFAISIFLACGVKIKTCKNCSVGAEYKGQTMNLEDTLIPLLVFVVLLAAAYLHPFRLVFWNLTAPITIGHTLLKKPAQNGFVCISFV